MNREQRNKRELAKLLLEAGVVQINVKSPFRLASGELSPIYVDCRKIWSNPQLRDKVVELAVELINSNHGQRGAD